MRVFEKMSSSVNKPVLKIFCSGCSQKLDVTEFKSFSNFPCPVCKNNIVVPKKLEDLYLLEKVSEDDECEVFVGKKDDKDVTVKVFKKKIEGKLGALACLKMLTNKYSDFNFFESEGQIAGYKDGIVTQEKPQKKDEEAKGKKSKGATKSLAKKTKDKAKKKIAEKSTKTSQSKPKLDAGKISAKAGKLKRRSKSSNSAFILAGVIAAIVLIAFIAMPGSTDSKKDEVSMIVEEGEVKNKKADKKRRLELEKKQELARLEEERRLEIEKEAELARKEKEKRQQELEKEKEFARQAAEKERQLELGAFLDVINPPQAKLDHFKTLPAVSAANLKALMKKHCVECHNAKKTKGDLNLDVFNSPITIYRGYEMIKQGYESIVHGDMPPDEDDISESELKHLKAYLEKLIYTLESKPSNMKTTALIRRLTPYEYDNTVTDITGLDLNIGESFPADGGGNQGFTNDAYVMGVSPILMEKFIEAAERISAYSVFDIEKGISFNKREVSAALADVFESDLRKTIYSVSSKAYPGKFSIEGTLPNLMKAVSELYHNTGQKETLEVVAKRHRVYPVFIQKALRYFSSSAGKSEMEHKALKKWKSLRRGNVEDKDLKEAIKQFVDFYKASNFFLVNRRHKDRKKHIGLARNVESLFFLDEKSASVELQGSQVSKYYKAIDFYTYSRYASSPREGKEVYTHVSPLIRKFLYKVYRRPPYDQELSIRTKDFMNDSITYGMPVAARILVIREFSSLNFAFRIESKKSSKIDDYDLASRLSYFLWAGPPDDELLGLASKGELNKEENLLKQIERMLKDKKSARLAKHFANQWLKFGDILGAEGPSSEMYKGFDEQLAKDMWQETAMCFNYIVKNDRSILEILDADYTIINGRLSKLYGLGAGSSSFKKVSVDSNKRGGILGHASFLTMTSMSRRTSPILRGNWVLTTLLGLTTPPPPMDVPEIPDEDSVSETFTLEQQLAKHRNVAACRGCHKKIDPLGIVLENYDLVGRWRNNYANASIVSNAKMNGEEMNGLAGLKKYLLKNKVQFIRNLSKKMISYGLGRSVYFYDNYLVNKMIENSIRNNYKFSSLVKTFVLSSQFQHK